jgi:hypothetical protein
VFRDRGPAEAPAVDETVTTVKQIT